MHRALVLLVPLVLAGCAGSRFAPLEGMPTALGESVRVGSLVATPRRVVEDSRCPLTVQCVQAGRLIVSTRLEGEGWRETVPLTLGEPYATHGTSITLVSALPEKLAGEEIPAPTYSFAFEGGA